MNMSSVWRRQEARPGQMLKVATLLLIWPLQLAAATLTGWIGTYTTDNAQSTGSSGIYAFRWDTDRGVLSGIRPAGNTTNPSFIVLHPSGRFLYAVNEDAAPSGTDRITAFAVGDAASFGALKTLGSVSSHGLAPCHLSIDPTGKWLFVANYLSGTIAVVPIEPDGRLGEATQTIQQKGSGPVTGRQGSAHAHEVVPSPDGRFLLSVDLGADRIFVYRFEAATGTLHANSPAEAVLPSGYGPRHMVFSKDGRRVYLLTELTPAVITLSWDAQRGSLSQLAVTSTLPAEYKGEKDGGAEIVLHPSGKFLYASNRGDSNTIAIFRIARGGLPVPAGHVASGGSKPRFFGTDPSGKFLITANQGSGDLFTFRIDPVSGALTRLGERIAVPAPVDLLFGPALAH
ncbi:MAG: lactonase family protein [Steroidobacteraceae bacterium]